MSCSSQPRSSRQQPALLATLCSRGPPRTLSRDTSCPRPPRARARRVSLSDHYAGRARRRPRFRARRQVWLTQEREQQQQQAVPRRPAARAARRHTAGRTICDGTRPLPGVEQAQIALPGARQQEIPRAVPGWLLARAPAPAPCARERHPPSLSELASHAAARGRRPGPPPRALTQSSAR